MTDKLLPCPWCGNEPRRCPDTSYGYATVFCSDDNDCPVSPVADASLDEGGLNEAIRRWNTRLETRPAPSEHEGLVERLRLYGQCGGKEARDFREAADAIEALSRRSAGDVGETGWLIETTGPDNAPQWLETLPMLDGGWTKDSCSAIRFARREDADTFVNYYLGEPDPELGIDLRITEHQWAAALSAFPTVELAGEREAIADKLAWEMENNFDGHCYLITQDTLDAALSAIRQRGGR